MLPISYLKTIAAYIVYESSIPKYGKIQMLRFIENEASASQLAILINEGEIRSIEKNELLVEIPILIPAIVATAITGGEIAYQKFFGQAAKACYGKKNEEKRKCISNFKVKANSVKLSTLKREMSKCNQTDNIKKCQKIFMNHITTIENQIKKDRMVS